MSTAETNTAPISTGKAAKKMGVTRCTVLNMIKRGDIAAIRVGRTYRIDPAVVARLSPVRTSPATSP